MSADGKNLRGGGSLGGIGRPYK